MARARGRKLLGIAAAVVVLGCLGVYGYTVLAKPASAVDPSRVVAVERGDLARSVVATGKIEPKTTYILLVDDVVLEAGIYKK